MIMDNKCKLCGKPIDLEEYMPQMRIPQFMKANHLCFHCAFWFVRKDEDNELLMRADYGKDDPIPLVTPDWSHWIVRPFRNCFFKSSSFNATRLESTRWYLGMVYKLPTGEEKLWLIDNNNIAHQGTIPEHLHHLFEPNAIYLPLSEWMRLQNKREITSAELKNMIRENIKTE